MTNDNLLPTPPNGMPAAADSAASPQSLVFYRCRPPGSTAATMGHDARTKMAVAESLADLLGLPFAGELDAERPPPGRLFIVPSDTLSAEAAERLGIRAASQLFGGVVPHPFVATKVITHPLVADDAAAPAGWSAALGERMRPVVLPGYSAFAAADATLAGVRLLRDGPVRIKQAGGVGGSGQFVALDRQQLEAGIAALDGAALAAEGVVVERNLADVVTFSVGQVTVGPWQASYCGTQQLTRNHRGAEVYGGSSLTVARGDYAALLRLDLDDALRLAVEQALAYHAAALACFPGIRVSRCNYDVAQGLGPGAERLSGVLEQSWRIGGASGAEVAALQAFKADPALQAVRASTHERYADMAPPSGSLIHYDGTDDQVGRLVKYAEVH